MAFLLFPEGDHAWTAVSVRAAGVWLSAVGEPVAEPCAAPGRTAAARAPAFFVARFGPAAGPPRFVLIAPGDVVVWVNGWPLAGGIGELCHQDEIRVAGEPPFFFSRESLAVVRPAAPGPRGGSSPGVCPRCSQPVEPAAPSVECPGCGLVYHQDAAAGLECFTYHDVCARCDGSTTLAPGLAWLPDA